ncbi:hypothetical protein PHABIO_37 [Pseudomonas phage Phabio]|uniref:Uncharacterized protein n=1 Tax=Pseudomonas phage Phabio TaxID=2006668 RepID=A0A1Y0SZL0_9CAUD|nr:hypothetical protein MZD05_gp037 [Pseudomonas phage Phabio]ARV76668.1 hypothetical protein PHABIO_37 [Pseudomonas phage Phabio]
MSKEPCRPGKSKSVRRREAADKHNQAYEERVKPFLEALESVVAPSPIKSVAGQEVGRSLRVTHEDNKGEVKELNSDEVNVHQGKITVKRDIHPGDIIIVSGADHGRMVARELIDSFKHEIKPKQVGHYAESRYQATYPKRYLERT